MPPDTRLLSNRFPRASTYHPEWVLAGVSGGANPLQLVLDADKAVRASFLRAGGTGASCGIGPELVAAVPLLAWLHGRRRRPRSA